MNIEHLYEFVELSRQLNFTSTAKTLHMTQPALSNHVRSLEQETGVLLIERSSGGKARLTPAGQYFLENAQQIVSLHAQMLPKLKELQREIKGKIVVRSPRNEYSDPLLDFIFEFRRQHPQIDIAIVPWNEVDGIEDVRSGAVDCAYVGYADAERAEIVDAAEVGLAPYTSSEIYLWMDRSHELANKDPLTPADLENRSLLIPANKKHESWYAGVSSFINRFGLDCRIEEKFCDSLEDLILAKADADDLMLCDDNLLSSLSFRLREDRIARHFTPRVRMPISLAYRTHGNDGIDGGNSLALKAFVDFLRQKEESA